MNVPEKATDVADPSEPHRGLSRRALLMAALFPVLGLFALLVWGTIQSGGRPGGFGINTQFGEVKVKRQLARPFDLTLLDGNTLTLEALKGQVVMVDFWASWCPPCRQEAPVLAQVYREYADKGVKFIGIAIWDSQNEALKFVDRYGVTYPNGLDQKGSIAIDYGVSGIPEKYFISREGILVKKFIGPVNREKLIQTLDELLAE